jgi:predicted DNA-binding protein
VKKLGKVVKQSSVRVSPITRLRLKKMSAKTGVKMIHLADEAVQKFCEKQEVK